VLLLGKSNGFDPKPMLLLSKFNCFDPKPMRVFSRTNGSKLSVKLLVGRSKPMPSLSSSTGSDPTPRLSHGKSYDFDAGAKLLQSLDRRRSSMRGSGWLLELFRSRLGAQWCRSRLHRSLRDDRNGGSSLLRSEAAHGCLHVNSHLAPTHAHHCTAPTGVEFRALLDFVSRLVSTNVMCRKQNRAG